VAVNFIGGGNRNTRRKPPNLNPTTTHAREVVPIITTKVVSSNLAHGEVYSIQHYAVNFFSGLQQSVVFVESGDKYHNIYDQNHDVTSLELRTGETEDKRN
jgi:anthranilate/para-aminobenzoate synthase component II